MSLTSKIWKAIRNPQAAIHYFAAGHWKERNYVWESETTKIRRKQYKSYSEYLLHQKSKLGKIKDSWLPEQDRAYSTALHERLGHDGIRPGQSVLCLGARTGAEVRVFIKLGCFAVGVDLNPGLKNKYVVVGDFHNLQYSDSSLDVVYTNSLDHSYDLNKVIAEIKRVLKSEGILILEIMKGESEGVKPRYYESMTWDTVDTVLKEFANAGFFISSQCSFEYPWPGQHAVLKLKEKEVASPNRMQ